MADVEKADSSSMEKSPKSETNKEQINNKSTPNVPTKPMDFFSQERKALEKSGIPTTGMEKGFHNFMNPMLAQMEASVKKNNDMLDEIHRKMEQEREDNRKKRLSQHIPGPLQGHGQKIEDIMKHIENLIINENFTDDAPDETRFVKAKLKELDDHGQVAVLGHSLAAYVSTLDPTHLRQFTTRIVSDTTLWVSRLFRFNDSSAYFHEEEREGLVRICRLALHQKYPKYAIDGYDALYPRPPVIYISAAAKPGLGQYICTHLGLPLSCLNTVPLCSVIGSQHKMDIEALEKLIPDDIAAGKTPVLLISYAGTPIMGQVDNVQKLAVVCKNHEMWLHIEGNNLATLSMFSVPTSISPAKSGDSMTLNLGGWLGLPSVPYVTLYKTADPALAHAAGLTSFNARYKLNCLPLWLCLQSLGHEGVIERVKHSIGLADQMSETIETISTLRHVSKRRKPPDTKKGKNSLGELISKAISALVIFEIENPTVVFRYQELEKEAKNGAGANIGAGDGTDDDEEMQTSVAESEEKRNPYIDSLNVWLSETMKREVPRIHITAVEIEGEGVCIRFSPLETAQIFDTKPEHIEQFLSALKKQISILDATIQKREELNDILESRDNLRLVYLPNWAGLGAVQFISEPWVDQVDNLTDEGRSEINTLNTQLVQQLKSADTAFSLGTTQDGLACVRFGLVTEDTELEELIDLVYSTGKEVEDSSKFLETMADVVRQGIEKANQDLVVENQHKLMQEGVLRQVPLVGSLFNWFSPPPKDTAKGRTFNLASGKIESTEKTYQYHMQVQEQTPETTLNGKSPGNASGKRSSLKGSRQSTPGGSTSSVEVKFYQNPKDSNSSIKQNNVDTDTSDDKSPQGITLDTKVPIENAHEVKEKPQISESGDAPSAATEMPQDLK